MLVDYSAPEAADDNWLDAVPGLGGVSRHASVRDLSAAFDELIWRACADSADQTQELVRRAHLGHRAQSASAPAPCARDTPKAIAWDLVSFESRSHIMAVWSVVSSRHRYFGFVPRVGRVGAGHIPRHGRHDGPTACRQYI